ncbi:MAG: hypothetical protein Q9170_000518 [Blastenia crenularia]
MASKQDIGLLVGLGRYLDSEGPLDQADLAVIFGFCASQVVHKQLLAVRKASEITHTASIESVPTQKNEDAIKLETLDELSKNANEDIRNAAVKIVVDRACKSKACPLILRDLAGKKREQTNKALTTVKYLLHHADRKTLVQSVIDCLSHQLPLSYRYEMGKAKGEVIQRTQPECDALELLRILTLKYGVALVLECNVFNLWLAKYPFGARFEYKFPDDKAAQLAAKHRLVHGMSVGKDSDWALAGILNSILASEEAVEKMISFGLMSRSVDEQHHTNKDETEDEYSKIWQEVHGFSNTTDVGLGPMMRRGVRAPEESWEEQLMRRRRREVMVLGETGRPIEAENIIQRVDT